MSRTWEEQREEIQRLNDLCIEQAAKFIEDKEQIVKGVAKDGTPYYTSALDGMDMLARCSSIAKQWTSELRQSQPTEKEKPEASDEQLARKARNVG